MASANANSKWLRPILAVSAVTAFKTSSQNSNKPNNAALTRPTPVAEVKPPAEKKTETSPFSVYHKKALEYYKKLDGQLKAVPMMDEMTKKTGLGRIELVLCCVGAFVFVLLVAMNVGARFLTHAGGYCYPALQSLKAADSGKKDEVVKWLSFWVIYAGMTLVEYLDSALFALLPYYFLFKLIFMLWLALPPFNGANRFYVNFLQYLVKPAKPPPISEPAKESAPTAKTAAAPAKTTTGWHYAPLSRAIR